MDRHVRYAPGRVGKVVDMTIDPPFVLAVRRLEVRGSAREKRILWLRPDEVEVLLELKQ